MKVSQVHLSQPVLNTCSELQGDKQYITNKTNFSEQLKEVKQDTKKPYKQYCFITRGVRSLLVFISTLRSQVAQKHTTTSEPQAVHPSTLSKTPDALQADNAPNSTPVVSSTGETQSPAAVEPAPPLPENVSTGSTAGKNSTSRSVLSLSEGSEEVKRQLVEKRGSSVPSVVPPPPPLPLFAPEVLVGQKNNASTAPLSLADEMANFKLRAPKERVLSESAPRPLNFDNELFAKLAKINAAAGVKDMPADQPLSKAALEIAEMRKAYNSAGEVQKRLENDARAEAKVALALKAEEQEKAEAEEKKQAEEVAKAAANALRSQIKYDHRGIPVPPPLPVVETDKNSTPGANPGNAAKLNIIRGTNTALQQKTINLQGQLIKQLAEGGFSKILKSRASDNIDSPARREIAQLIRAQNKDSE